MAKLLMLVFLALFFLSPIRGMATAQVSADAALITNLEGAVAFQNGEDSNKSSAALSFMKLHAGDRLDLSAKSSVQVLFFASGRQETWRGPISLIIEMERSRADRVNGPSPEPEVKMLPVKATGRMSASSLPLPNAKTQVSGAIRTMEVTVKSKKPPRDSSRRPDSQAQLKEAKKLYRELRKATPQSDPTPEIYYLGVLADNRRYEEMGGIIKEMLKKRPGDQVLLDLKAWVAEQSRP